MVLQLAGKSIQFAASLMLAISLVLSGPAMSEMVCPTGHGSHAGHLEGAHPNSVRQGKSQKKHQEFAKNVHHHEQADETGANVHASLVHDGKHDAYCAQYCGCGDTKTHFAVSRNDGPEYTAPNFRPLNQFYGTLFEQNEVRPEGHARHITQPGVLRGVLVGHPYKHHYARTMRALT